LPLRFYHKINKKIKTSIKQIQTHTFTFTIYIYITHTLQIIKIQKLNKNYIKQFKNYKTAPKKSWNCRERLCEASRTAGIVAARLLYAPPLENPGK
jgi:hypothetical protein